MKLIHRLARFLWPKGKLSFINSLPINADILDVGCGSEQIIGVKYIRPKCKYTGIDIADYMQTEFSKKLMDTYVLTSANNFAKKILELESCFDGVISSHNLEHCDKPTDVICSMLKKVKINGKIYLSFPCPQSVNFPSRTGTLNYFDDKTHKSFPPNSEYIIKLLINNNFIITFYKKRYRPVLLFLIGLFLEPISFLKKKVMRGTWELYGFETVIHAKKLK
jgi:SAM-dependent methyltransferase